MSKEKNLCRAVAMAADQPILLQRAIDTYRIEAINLSETERELLRDAEEYLKDIQELEKDYHGLLDALYDLAGKNILDIEYQD